MIRDQQRMLGLMKELLGDNFLHFDVVGYDLHEDFGRGETQIACKIADNNSGEITVIEGQGVGVIDAFFHGLLNRMAVEYASLETVELDMFVVNAKLGAGKEKSQTDALAEVTIGMRNSRGNHFEFTHESRSVTRSAIEATLRAAEYFVNAERAFIEAFTSLKGCRQQGRQDLEKRYTSLMAEIVRNTSYSEVIERINEEMTKG
jgi:hypothetical protein